MSTPKKADSYCGKCYLTHSPSLFSTPDHEPVFVFETHNEAEVYCPWCGVENSNDDLGASGVIECEECGREFSYEVDYTPDYTTSRPTCYCCGVETPKARWTKLGSDCDACSDECADRCNAAYDAYLTANRTARLWPRRGFGKATL